MVDINIKLHKETDDKGRDYYWTEYDSSQIKELSFVLLSDPALREMTLMTAANIIAHEDKATERWKAMEELIQEIRDEEKERKIKLHRKGVPYEV